MQSLKREELAVLLVIHELQREHGEGVGFAMVEIADHAGVSYETVKRYVKRFQRGGLLERRPTEGHGRPYSYRLLCDLADIQQQHRRILEKERRYAARAS